MRHARNIKNRFGNNQAADQECRLNADDGGHGQDGVFQGMVIIDGIFRGALGTRRADIVLAHDLQHG